MEFATHLFNSLSTKSLQVSTCFRIDFEILECRYGTSLITLFGYVREREAKLPCVPSVFKFNDSVASWTSRSRVHVEKLIASQLVRRHTILGSHYRVPTAPYSESTGSSDTEETVLVWGHGEGLLVSAQPKSNARLLSAIRNCLFSTFAVTLHVQMFPLPCATQQRLMLRIKCGIWT
jgi:hypothetical protein